MKTTTVVILGIFGLAIAGIIGFFIYRSSQQVAAASQQAGASAGEALGTSLANQAVAGIGDLLGIHHG